MLKKKKKFLEYKIEKCKRRKISDIYAFKKIYFVRKKNELKD